MSVQDELMQTVKAAAQRKPAQPVNYEEWAELVRMERTRKREALEQLHETNERLIDVLMENLQRREQGILDDQVITSLKAMVGYLLEGSVQWQRGVPERPGFYLAAWVDCPPEIAQYGGEKPDKEGEEPDQFKSFVWKRYISGQEPGTYWSRPVWWANSPAEVVNFHEFKQAYEQKLDDQERLYVQYVQAVGLASTLHPTMLIDVDDPIGMMRQVAELVNAERSVEPQWEVIPDEYPWHATDEDGQSAAYSTMPVPYKEQWGLPPSMKGGKGKVLLTNTVKHGLAMPWQSTLRYRPEGRAYGAKAKAD